MFQGLQELETSREPYWREGHVDWLVGAFLIARREAVDAVGLMDDRFFLYSEEIDWCYRFWESGWPVAHLPVMTVVHHTGDRTRGDLMAQLSHSRLLFADKHYRAARTMGIRIALGLGHLIRIGVFGLTSLASDASRSRVRDEVRALGVVLGRSGPPLGPYAATSLKATDATIEPAEIT
jgi:GT2 family glycosyltransferase